jgi:16S rRNA (guanine527-N7)-methyltransferase
MVLIERARRRVDFLRWAVAELGWQERIRVYLGEAEDAGRDPELAGAFDVVTARSFGPAAVTAECACRLLRLGGQLVVSEPPGAPDRWPGDALRSLGLTPATLLGDGPARLAVLTRDQELELDPVYPRRAGVPRRRPLF